MRKLPSLSSAGRDAAAGRRSSDFGVITISGRRSAWRAWRRSRWKYCAGVVG